MGHVLQAFLFDKESTMTMNFSTCRQCLAVKFLECVGESLKLSTDYRIFRSPAPMRAPHQALISVVNQTQSTRVTG